MSLASLLRRASLHTAPSFLLGLGFASLLTLLAGLGCDGVGSDAASVITELSIEFGSEELAVVGEAVTVQAFVTDQFGIAVEGADVDWSVSAGMITPATSTTDAEGLATATWTLGTEAGNVSTGEGAQQITATVDGAVSATQEVFAAIGPVGDIEVALDADTLAVNTVDALRVVAIEDVYGNAVPLEEFGSYGVAFTSLDTSVVEVGPPPTGEAGLVVGVEAVGVGVAQVVATAAAPPGVVGKGTRLAAGAAADTVTVTVVPFVSGGPFPAEAISGGFGFTCGLGPGGTVYCWGANAAGQLGTGDFTPRLTPTLVVGLPGSAVAVSAGISHTCAVLTDGRVFCWGDQLYGRLGNGVAEGSQPTPVEALLPAEALPVVEVRAGGASTCARTSDGEAYCWGYDGAGTVGDGAPPEPTDPESLLFHVTPQPVVSPGGAFAALSNVALHACAVDEGGAAYCWGDASDGVLGIGFTVDFNAPAPEQVQPTTIAFAAVATHVEATSALDTAGQLYGWGAASSPDPSGSGLPSLAFTATPVATSETFIALSGGNGYHGCALTASGDAHCWGRNSFGQLGTGDTDSTVTPVPVQPDDPDLRFASVSVGVSHSCAVRDGKPEAYCWGSNQFGELGNGEQTTAPVPVPTRVETGGTLRGGFPAALRAGSAVDPRIHRGAWCAALDPHLRTKVGVCRTAPF